MSDPFDLAGLAEDNPAGPPAKAPEPHYLAALNAEQRAAVEAVAEASAADDDTDDKSGEDVEDTE